MPRIETADVPVHRTTGGRGRAKLVFSNKAVLKTVLSTSTFVSVRRIPVRGCMGQELSVRQTVSEDYRPALPDSAAPGSPRPTVAYE